MKRIYGIIVFILLGDSIFGQTTKSKIEGTWALCATYQTEVPITLIVYDRNFNWEYFFKKDLNAVNKSWNMTDTSRFIY